MRKVSRGMKVYHKVFKKQWGRGTVQVPSAKDRPGKALVHFPRRYDGAVWIQVVDLVISKKGSKLRRKL